MSNGDVFYLNSDDKGKSFTTVGLISEASARKITVKRVKNGDRPGTDFRFLKA